ncbi:MAG: hypothetical protein B7Z75_03815 [Acidocella sp. 20-57-95]|nr:MAG: hypothetical protein B7Z75_03815 [Acidocella sp. 20-57-95]OYV62295.1 MAG: hypothetical protein B7Z71_01650 [Acidocella sp. 21-58-7]HQT63945.1 hypothetical protein [Acidocella sp.]HQU03233.1 hypothetical protein [Acidocella sp.]
MNDTPPAETTWQGRYDNALMVVKKLVPPSLFPALFLLPFVYGIFRLLHRHIQQFLDTETIICAGNNVLTHTPIYAPTNCFGMVPTSFVYPPITAWLESAIQPRIGATGVIMMFGFIYFTVFAAVLRAALRRDTLLYWRAPFLLSFSASGLMEGNVSIIFHGTLFFLALATLDTPLLLWPAIVLAAVLKPPIAIYAVLFMFHDQKFIRRIILAGSAILAILVITGATYFIDPQNFSQWLHQLQIVHTVFVQGHSIMATLEFFGIRNALAEFIIYLPFALAILGAGLLVAHYGRLPPAERIMLGITICLLLYPRLLDYDQFTLPFGLAVLAECFSLVSWPGKIWFRRILLGGCATFAIAGGVRGGLILFWFSVLLLFTLAIQLAFQDRKNLTSFARGVLRPVS